MYKVQFSTGSGWLDYTTPRSRPRADYAMRQAERRSAELRDGWLYRVVVAE